MQVACLRCLPARKPLRRFSTLRRFPPFLPCRTPIQSISDTHPVDIGHRSDPIRKLSDISPDDCPASIGTLSALNRNAVRLRIGLVSGLRRNTQYRWAGIRGSAGAEHRLPDAPFRGSARLGKSASERAGGEPETCPGGNSKPTPGDLIRRTMMGPPLGTESDILRCQKRRVLTEGR